MIGGYVLAERELVAQCIIRPTRPINVARSEENLAKMGWRQIVRIGQAPIWAIGRRKCRVLAHAAGVEVVRADMGESGDANYPRIVCEQDAWELDLEWAAGTVAECLVMEGDE